MTKMTFQEAAMDPNRPLSITPREWMYSVEASLAEDEQLTNGTAKRIVASEKGVSVVEDVNVDGLEKIDLGVDQIIQGIKILYRGIEAAKEANLRPLERKIVDKVKDLVDTAISPYMSDIIKELDGLDVEDE